MKLTRIWPRMLRHERPACESGQRKPPLSKQGSARRRFAGFCSLLALCAGSGQALADTNFPADTAAYLSDASSFGLLGGVGLLATRTARMLPDGEVAAGTTYQDPMRGVFMTWQALPWLEATARLSEAAGTTNDLDRALDLKIRLYEGGAFPAVALGFQDVLGSGPFAGEYLVFSKAFGNVDASFGFGWGYPGSRDHFGNPLKKLTGSTRGQSRGGLPQAKDFFAGDFGLFGGLAYATPIHGLSLKLEYDGGDPRRLALDEPATGGFPLNIGADYRPLSWLHLSVGLMRGNTLGAGLALRFNPVRLVPARKGRDHAPMAVPISPRPALAASSATVLPPPVLSAPVSGGGAPVASTGLPQDSLTRVTRALFLAGIDEPMLDVERPGEATLTVSFTPGLETRQALLVAYVAFAALPASYETVIVRNRKGDEVGLEGQRFTRGLVAEFARADASFNDLLRAGGVRGVTLRGADVEASVNGGADAAAAAAVALSGLAPEAGGRIAVETADALTRADAASLTAERQRTQAERYLDGMGMRLRSLDARDRQASIAADLTREMTPESLQMAADALRAIFGASVDGLTLAAYRSERVVARVTVPKASSAAGPDYPPGYRANIPGDADHPVQREIPLFGYVAWSAPAPQPLMPAGGVARLAPLTAPEAGDLFARTRAQGLRPVAARLDGRVASLAFANDRYASPAQAIGRAARAISAGAPLDVDWLELITVEDGVEVGRVQILRQDFEKADHALGSPEEVWIHTTVARERAAFPAVDGWQRAEPSWHGFRWALYPEFLQHFGRGDEDGYRAGIYANLSAAVDIFHNLRLSATLSREIGSSLDRIAGRPLSSVPVVRSDMARYAAEGTNALRDARLDYTVQPFRDLYVRLSAGYFERMYGGLGGEILYAPAGSRTAFGVDVNQVKKRDFDQKLGFGDYSIVTGQATLYHLWTRYGIETRLSVGRYLAGDWGASLDISRQFENGVRVGAWATVTDMSNADYGGDAPAKGLYLSVPLDLVLPWSMKRDFGVAVRALNRDGGQMLDKGPGLYDLVRQGQRRRLEGDWRNLMD